MTAAQGQIAANDHRRGWLDPTFKKIARNRGNRVFIRYLSWVFVALAVHLAGSDLLWRNSAIFWSVAVGFFVDDYMFGDDDDLKRRWSAVKNSVKWKMKLPEPAPARSGTN